MVIDESQSGFMNNRHISNNIRLVLEVLDYSKSNILLLDFYKAFDSVEHQFIISSLEKFGFGPLFNKAVRTLYSNCNGSIKLHSGTTPQSFKGTTLISKAEGIWRLAYAALSLFVNSQSTQSIDKMLVQLLWKNKMHYIKKSVVMNTYENGGSNFLDLNTLNKTFKVNWIKQFLKKPNSMWNLISSHVYSKVGGLKFLLGCNCNIEKIPIHLSSFHKEASLAWWLLYKHNFSPHSYSMWNNRDILYKSKT